MAASIPRVALLIESSRAYGRGILRDIARYAHVNGPWSIYSQERELHSGIPGWLKGWKGDGIALFAAAGRRWTDDRLVAPGNFFFGPGPPCYLPSMARKLPIRLKPTETRPAA